MNSFKLYTILFLVLILVPKSSEAVVLFQEDFNTGDASIVRVPTIVDSGTDNDWYGTRFENTGGFIKDLVGISPNGNTPADNRYGFASNDTALLFHISTLGYSDVKLTFDWRTSSFTDPSQPFAYGYFTGNITGFDADRSIDLYDPMNAASWSNWTSTVLGTSNLAFINEMVSLPSGQQDVWVAFTLQNGFKRYGEVDNLEVTGNVVPEPATLSLFGMGILGFIQKIRRKK